MKYKLMICLAVFFVLFKTTSVLADPPVIINNNNGTTTPQNSCNNAAPTDPRVPPAGAYQVKNPNGTTSDIYTTGETKPYNADNSCNNNNSSSAPQPYVFATPPPRR